MVYRSSQDYSDIFIEIGRYLRRWRCALAISVGGQVHNRGAALEEATEENPTDQINYDPFESSCLFASIPNLYSI